MLLYCSVMPRLSSTLSKHRLHQVAVTALFATLASSSSSSAFNPLATTTRGPFLVSRGGYSSIFVPGDRRVAFTTSKSSSMSSSTVTDTAEATTLASLSPSEKLEALRAKMKELDLDVYLVPSDDPHLSGMWEYYFLCFLSFKVSSSKYVFDFHQSTCRQRICVVNS